MKRLFPVAGVSVIVLLQYTIATLGTFPLTPAPFVVALALLAVTRGLPPPRVVLAGLVVAAWPLLVVLTTPKPYDFEEFVRTYILWSFALICTAAFAWSRLRPAPERLAVIALGALVICVVFSVMQVVQAEGGSDALYMPFGSHTYFGGYDVFERATFARASAFFIEPSFNALVCCVLALVCVLHGSKAVSWSALALLLGAVGLTQSLAGALASVAIVALAIRHRSAHGGLAIVTRALPLLVVAFVALFVIGVGWVVERLASTAQVGSSANYRLVAPLEVIGDLFSQSPLGLPLGSIEQTLSQYHLRNGTLVGTSLDNGIYLFLYYTGVLGAFIVLAAFVAIISWFLRGSTDKALLGVCLTSFTVFTGGILLPEFVLLTCLVLYAWRTRPQDPDPRRHPLVTTSALARHDHAQQPGRAASNGQESQRTTA